MKHILIITLLSVLLVNIVRSQNKYIDELCNNYSEFDSLDINFILEWQKNVQPISNSGFQKLNKYEKNAYEIFETWYSSDFSNYYNPMANRQFYIIQDTLKYLVTKKDSSELMAGEGAFRRMKTKDLADARMYGTPIPIFLPRLNINAKDLHLKGIYAKTFMDFMNDSICDCTDSPRSDELFKRVIYFGKYTNVSERHWLNGWTYYPLVQSITINENCTWAFLVWQDWSSAGFSLMVLNSEGWMMSNSAILATQ